MTLRRVPVRRLALGTAVVLLCWGLAGCARLPADQQGIPGAEEVGHVLLRDWLAASGHHDRLQGVAKIRVQTAERTVTATQVLLAERPDRLRAETLSPFGTPLLVMASDGTDLGVLIPGDNLFYHGRATPENIGRFTRLPLHPADLVNILLARPPLLAHRQLSTFALSEGRWRVDLENGTRGQQLVFDAARRLQEVRFLQDGDLRLKIVYGEFDPGLHDFPRRIELELPLQQTRASLAFSELATDRRIQPGAFTLAPPAGATVVRLDEVAAAGERSDGKEQPSAEPPEQGEGGH